MDTQDIFFKPVNAEHSIKEAVISLFLTNPIENPDSYTNLLPQFKGDFNRFDQLERVTLKGQIKPGGFDNVTKSLMPTVIGFRFVNAGENNILKQILQGSNEENRSFISYHNLSYVRWTDFINSFLKHIHTLTSHKDLLINGFSLHYVDEFEIIGDMDKQIDFSKLFKDNSVILPKSFFKSAPLRYLHQFINGEYVEQLEIRTIMRNNPFIAISHNASKMMESEQSAVELIKSISFTEMLHKMHDNNKNALNELLTEEIKSKINLIF